MFGVNGKSTDMIWHLFSCTLKCCIYLTVFTIRNQSLISKSVDTLKADKEVNFSKEDSFLPVYLTKKQKEWLEPNSNVITCMDGVYKTLTSGFPCYFLVVKTSIVIGRVVGTIIPQYETEELVAEGLRIIKLWSSRWSPRFFMTDKSSQELGMDIYKRYCV